MILHVRAQEDAVIMAYHAANVPSPSPFNRQRRGTSPAHFEYRERRPAPPAKPLGLPNPSFLQDLTGSLGGRSITDSASEDGDEDEDPASNAWGGGQQRHRSNSSTSGFADLATRVGNVVSSIASQPRSPVSRSYTPSLHPSDAELEAEAIREREHSRREAERILMKEAEERRRLENASQPNLAPPNPQTPSRPRRETIDIPSNRASGDSHISPGGTRWWSIAKQKLTPTKDKEDPNAPLTPAQEIIRESKLREKEEKLAEMEREKERLRQGKGEWPASPKTKQNDPTYLAMQTTSPNTRPSPQQQYSPRPIQQNTSPRLIQQNPSPSFGQKIVTPMTPPQVPSSSRTTALNFSPSPAPRAAGASGSGTEQPPLYAQFNRSTGALDIPATLLTVATRFEKLEKWTVNHVRALEERMKDVERYVSLSRDLRCLLKLRIVDTSLTERVEKKK